MKREIVQIKSGTLRTRKAFAWYPQIIKDPCDGKEYMIWWETYYIVERKECGEWVEQYQTLHNVVHPTE